MACVFFFARKEVISLNKICNLLITQPKVRREAYELNKQPVWWINFQNGYYDLKMLITVKLDI